MIITFLRRRRRKSWDAGRFLCGWSRGVPYESPSEGGKLDKKKAKRRLKKEPSGTEKN